MGSQVELDIQLQIIGFPSEYFNDIVDNCKLVRGDVLSKLSKILVVLALL